MFWSHIPPLLPVHSSSTLSDIPPEYNAIPSTDFSVLFHIYLPYNEPNTQGAVLSAPKTGHNRIYERISLYENTIKKNAVRYFHQRFSVCRRRSCNRMYPCLSAAQRNLFLYFPFVPDITVPASDPRSGSSGLFPAGCPQTFEILSAAVVLCLYKYLEILLPAFFGIYRFSKRTFTGFLCPIKRTLGSRRFSVFSPAPFPSGHSCLSDQHTPLRPASSPTPQHHCAKAPPDPV